MKLFDMTVDVGDAMDIVDKGFIIYSTILTTQGTDTFNLDKLLLDLEKQDFDISVYEVLYWVSEFISMGLLKVAVVT